MSAVGPSSRATSRMPLVGLSQRGVGGAVGPVRQRAGEGRLHFNQRQPGEFGIHRGLVALELRRQVGVDRFAQVRVGCDFQRHAVAQDGVADFGRGHAADHAPRLAVGRGIGEGAEPPEAVRFPAGAPAAFAACREIRGATFPRSSSARNRRPDFPEPAAPGRNIRRPLWIPAGASCKSRPLRRRPRGPEAARARKSNAAN